MSDYKYTPEEETLMKKDHSKVAIYAIAGTLVVLIAIAGIYFLGANTNKNTINSTNNTSNSSSLASLNISKSSSSVSSSPTTTSSSSSSASSSAVTPTPSPSVVVPTPSVTPVPVTPTPVAGTNPPPTVFTDQSLPGFKINNMDGYRLTSADNAAGIERRIFSRTCTTPESNLGCPGTIVIRFITTPTGQGFFVDSPVTTECVSIGNTWNRCKIGWNIPTTNRRDYVVDSSKVNLIGRSTIMSRSEYTDVISPNLTAIQVTFEMGNSSRDTADTFVSSIMF